MRICFYNLTAGFKTGGLETYCWEVGRALVSLGHEVHIVGGTGGAPRYSEVQLIALPYTPRQRFPNLGTRFRKLAERLSFARAALPQLMVGGYDAVVVNKPYDFPAIWQARRGGMKAVTAIRSGGTEFYLGDRYFARSIDCWFSTSAYNARQVEARYSRPVRVIPNGVDPDVFTPAKRTTMPRARYGIPDAAPLVVSAGRLVGWKGLHVVIEALTDIPEAHYLIIGDGEARPALQRLVAERGLTSRVHFSGEVPHRELPELLAAADVFVQPSIGEEAFGISVVEAMGCGLPVLASAQGGLREIVQPGVTGELLAAGDTGVWKDALSRHLDYGLRLKEGQAARQRVIDGFTWIANAKQLVTALAAGGAARSA